VCITRIEADNAEALYTKPNMASHIRTLSEYFSAIVRSYAPFSTALATLERTMTSDTFLCVLWRARSRTSVGALGVQRGNRHVAARLKFWSELIELGGIEGREIRRKDENYIDLQASQHPSVATQLLSSPFTQCVDISFMQSSPFDFQIVMDEKLISAWCHLSEMSIVAKKNSKNHGAFLQAFQTHACFINLRSTSNSPWDIFFLFPHRVLVLSCQSHDQSTSLSSNIHHGT
jgi:hypothetical protein